ncbi:MAG: hypothetical protein K5662_03820 [Lachnospiraceae bacterium]|nr:hypothetical protein [Lachnospiraceae bacterium]
MKAVFSLPGLFEFYELYKRFLPVFFENRDFFYDHCVIGSVYGAPPDCIWGGGRVEYGEADPKEVFDMMASYGISIRLTFSNSLLEEKHLVDKRCNSLCELALGYGKDINGVIVASDLLTEYIDKHYQGIYMVSSTTKVITDRKELTRELDRPEYRYVVPDFRLNDSFDYWSTLDDRQKAKVELLCNENCYYGCTERKRCYEDVSHKNLGDDHPEHICHAPGAGEGYRFSSAMRNRGFIGTDDMISKYLPLNITNYKIEGRALGSAMVLEFLLYYLTKPEYHINVREAIYLDNMLDLF